MERKDSKNRKLKKGEGVRKREGKPDQYYYRWIDSNGKMNYIYSASLNSLRKREMEIDDRKREGLKYPGQMSINDFYEMWIQVKRGLKPNTFRNYKYMYQTFIQPDFGLKKIKDLKKFDIRKFYIYLNEQRHLKICTIDCIHVILYQVLEMAVDEGYIRNNPASNAMTELKKVNNKEDSRRMALSINEQQLFEEALDLPVNQMLRPIFRVMLDTGLRVGEATGLCWCDIDFEKNEIKVDHTLVYYDHEDERGCTYGINTPKTKNSYRKVKMTSRLREILLEYKKFLKEVKIECTQIIDGYTDFVFLNRYGKVYSQNVLNKGLRRIQRDVNLRQIELSNKIGEDVILLPKFTCHVLRHTCATRLCESGVNTRFIMSMLGHSDIRTTMNIYVDVQEELELSEIEKFEAYVAR